MDMPVPAGVPWLIQPVTLHSSRENDCMLTPDECAYRNGHWRYWYRADLVYALATIYFAVVMIALFILAKLAPHIVPTSVQKSRPYRRVESLARYLSYRSYYIRGVNIYTAPLGLLLLLAASTLFFLALTLGPKPYYWPELTDGNSFGDSPPIATRSGWMALALMPFVLVLPTKMNFITAVTGVPHEKLQFFHQWSAHMMFVLALVHTFPFIIVNIARGDMTMQWMTNACYWTGVVAILAQAWLTFFSFEWLRRRYYEIFKATHILAAVVFVVFFFLHCDATLTAWDYFIAAGVLYASSYLLAGLRTLYEHGFKRARVSTLPNDTVRIVIPSVSEWTPGQHVFLRFPTLGLHHAITSHPFTICSLQESNEMVFYVKPHGGLTQRLHRLTAGRPETLLTVLLDGPYGGLQNDKLASYDEAVVVAGGSGAGFALPLIESVLRARCLDEKATARLRIVLATRHPETVVWFRAQLVALFGRYRAYEPGSVPSVAIYLTDINTTGPLDDLRDDRLEAALGAPTAAAATPDVADKSGLLVAADSRDGSGSDGEPSKEEDAAAAAAAYLPHVAVRRGRPDVASVVRQATLDARRVAVAACGPASMLHDVRGAAARRQLELAAASEAAELYLHTETFGL